MAAPNLPAAVIENRSDERQVFELLNALRRRVSGLTPSGALTGPAVVFTNASGALQVDTQNFVYDDANDRLGVGTSSPERRLHVSDSTDEDDRGALLTNAINSESASRVVMRKARGTVATPLIVADTDYAGTIGFGLYDGTQYLQTAVIGSHVATSTVPAAGAISTQLFLDVRDTGANDPYTGYGRVIPFTVTGQTSLVAFQNPMTVATGGVDNQGTLLVLGKTISTTLQAGPIGFPDLCKVIAGNDPGLNNARIAIRTDATFGAESAASLSLFNDRATAFHGASIQYYSSSAVTYGNDALVVGQTDGDIFFAFGGTTSVRMTFDRSLRLHDSTAAVSAASTAALRSFGGALQYSENGGPWQGFTAGFVPVTRTVQGTAPILIASDNAAHDLSANRVWSHAVSGVVAGAYTNANITVDATGHVTVAASGGAGTIYYQTLFENTVAQTQRAGINFTPNFDISDDGANNRTIIDLSQTGVTGAAYTSPTMTVDAYGRITAIASVSYVPGTRTVQGTAPILIAGDNAAHDLSANRVWSHDTSGVAAAAYAPPASVTVNATGHVTAASALSFTNGSVMSWSSGFYQDNANFYFDSVTLALCMGTTTSVAGERIRILGTKTRASAAGLTWNALHMPSATLTLSGSTNVTTATGLNLIEIGAPTITSGSALTVDYAATLRVRGDPIEGGSTTITNRRALWVDGFSYFDGAIKAVYCEATATIGSEAGLLYSGVGGSTFRSDASANKVAFFNVALSNQQTGGASTAGILYTATEQAMLQAAYDCLRTFGLLT